MQEQENEWIMQAKAGDRYAAGELIESKRGMTLKLATRYHRLFPQAEFEDLVQEGQMALFMALYNYRPEDGCFDHYAWTCISHGMSAALNVLLPYAATRTEIKNKKEIDQVAADFERRYCYTPDEKDLVELTGFSQKTVRKARQGFPTIVQFSDKVKGLGETTYADIVDLVSRNDDGPVEGWSYDEMQALIDHFIYDLPEWKRDMVDLRYKKCLPLRVVAEKYECSPQNVDKTCHQVLKDMRAKICEAMRA